MKLLVIFFIALVSACRSDPSRTNEPRPLSQGERRTTAGPIALANLDGEIESLQRRLADVPNDVGAAAALVDALSTRGLCRGRLVDHSRAALIAEEVPNVAPDDPRSFLLRARSRVTFHRFEAAMTDLRAAERLGAATGAVDNLRARILYEMGKGKQARQMLSSRDTDSANIVVLGTLATLQADQGALDEADATFARALDQYRDVSPFPVAWLYVQWGSSQEKRGRADAARAFYAAALDRIPDYVPALSKLADLEAASGHADQAIVYLRAAAAVSDDPDHLSRLARLLGERGHGSVAGPLREQAQSRFDALVAEHPEAFAAHAAEFWLDVGGDPHRALELAKLNWNNRRRPEDRALLARAERAAQ